MRNYEDYEEKLEVIKTIEDSQINTLKHIPAASFIQEADELYHWAAEDKEALTAAGLSWDLAEDIPLRCRALIDAEARWQTQWMNRKNDSHGWKKRSPHAYDLRGRLAADFRFAFRDYPGLTAAVGNTSRLQNHPKMIQDLNDLSVLGKANRRLLEAIHFDMSLLEEAARTSAEMAVLLAETTRFRLELKETKKIRDQAYTHLKEAVDQVRHTGRYVFRRNKNRITGYSSRYIRKLKSRQKAKSQKTED